MNKDDELVKLPGKPGDVRYFVHVHPTKPHRQVASAEGGGSIRLIEGKLRRMVIISKRWWFDYSTVSKVPSVEKPVDGDCDYYTAIARPGYFVVALRSEVPPRREKMHSEPLKDYLEVGRDSVISYLPIVYPAEAYRHGPFDVIRALQRDQIDHIIEELLRRGFCGDIVDPQVVSD